MRRPRVHGEDGGPGVGRGLVEETFFVGCGPREEEEEREETSSASTAAPASAPTASPPTPPAPLLQVRRYVYNDVVRLDDLQKLIDCSYVQSYTINSAKVVFLKQRPNTRPFKGSGNICLTCDRLLQSLPLLLPLLQG
ncbi:uncharacterized protein A4U43_C06F1270 [Asparagus officinalis]|uniref:Uncharacterized protein n=1 Tax=Asparagus officinalis TaxID=4686 RepID=A0A5P1EIU1_ASPOF|nr:uncharacterized protein A4U43_C06F1270 [Asparagus officinalis]